MLSEFCEMVLGLDSGIRFAGITERNGSIAAFSYRPGTVPLLDPVRLELAAAQSAIRSTTREAFEPEIGKAEYSITTYEKVKRATIPIHDGKRRLLLVSFKITARPGPIIRKKILPLIEEKFKGRPSF